jgi:PAS domain S-box-containing protein
LGPSWLLPALYAAAALLLVVYVALIIMRRRTPSKTAVAAASPNKQLDRTGLLGAGYDRALIGLGFVNVDWQWLDANRRLLSALGYAKSEMTNLPLRFLTHPEDRKREAPLFADIRAGKRTGYTMSKRLLRKSGDYKNVRVQMLRVSETPPVFQVTIDDSAQSSSPVEALASALAEVNETAAVMCDTTGVITGWNKGAERLFGYPADEVIGTSWTKLHASETKESLTRMVTAAAQNGSARSLNTRRRQDGSTVVVRSVIIADLLRGESSGFLELCHEESAARMTTPKATSAATIEVEEEEPWTSVAGEEIPDTLTRIADDARTGTLRIRSTQGEKRFIFEHGQLVACTSDRDERLLGQLLVDEGVLDEAQRAAALAAHRQNGGSFGSSVVDVSSVTEDDIANTIRGKARNEIADAASWPRAEWLFGDNASNLSSEMIPLAIDVRSLLAELYPHGPLVGRAEAKKPIYHVAACTAAQDIPRAHRIYFNSPVEAEEKGFKPCPRCQSEDEKPKGKVSKSARR